MIGSRLAHYEITAHLGSGGMGQVYQATDGRLGRRVAIKVLPDVFARDESRVARFEREARILASLNHPHIAAIYGLEESGGQAFLVMELVPGQTLAERLNGAPLPVRETLSIAVQICDALEAAHEAGVIHRDLKPANIKMTPDGRVKLLDFGLAKAPATEPSSAASYSPTISVMATQAGLILGTAPYMSPEQAKGKPIDRRTDIFAFGSVLYEMLTGRPAFEGETVSEILARVIEREPDWSRLPPTLPLRIRELLKRCLEKDATKRQRDSGDIRLELETALGDSSPDVRPVTTRVPRSSSRLAWALVTVLAAALASAVALPYFRGAADAPELRVEIGTPATADPTAFAIAPNGRSLVFVASGDGQPRLWLRRLDGSNAQPLPGTEEARHPFWSPDGRSVGFFKAGTLMRTEISGGMPQLITDASPGLGGAWGPDGSILFAPTFGSPLYRVPAEGGEAVALTELESPGQFSHRFPKFLPGGRQFLFYVLGTEEASGIYLGSLDDPKRMRRVTAADAAGAYVAPGWLLFVRQGALVARRFDPSTGELSGNAVQLAEAVRASDESLGAISASTTGMVAYRSGGETPTRLTWFDRSGKALDAVGGPDVTRLIDPELSPDGTRVAGTRTVQGNTDIWIVDRLRPIRLTADPAIDRFPIWSPDGARLLFGSTRTGPSDLYVKPSDGSSGEQLILPSPQVKNPNDWSPDGRFLLYFEIRERISPDLWALPLDETRKPFALADSPFPEVWGRFSPDGRWVAYQSNESGRWEIYVRPFPAPGGVWPISTSGGISPRWAPSGKELYYIAPDGTLMAVAITVTGATLDAGAPKALFQVRILGGGSNFVGRRQQYDVARDGRFLINVITDETSPSPITLVLNWRPEER